MDDPNRDQLIDSLVRLGYVERHADPKDGRRVVLRLSDKGRAAASVIGAAAASIDYEMRHRLGADALLELRRALQGFAHGPVGRSAPGAP